MARAFGLDTHGFYLDIYGRKHVEVQDTGCWIPDAFKERIFQPFSQADGADSKARLGNGLGLSFSKKLVLQMGGQLSFSSGVGIGTTFELRFPLLQS